ncbi:MAG TPA: hypothetical protein VLC98_02515 [Phnomibacter sp.]|nr:hypothetical protein [Phnomibacter sp.]
MRRSFIAPLLAVVLLFSSGCKEEIQKAKEDLVVDLIVNNIWVVTNFTEGSSNITANFSSYDFKFNRDESVYGRKAGSPDAVGTWKGDAAAMTITSSFPLGTEPLTKLTGVWNITKTTMSSVKSTRTEGGVTYFLELQKK